MRPDEYTRMRAAEDTHWWYAALRVVVREGMGRYPFEGPLLDAGCGTGGGLTVLDDGALAYGIDRAPEALDACKARGLPRLTRGDVTALPYRDDTFGAVMSMDVLYHRRVEPGRALAEYRRVLRSGGVVYLNLPAYEWLRSAHDTVIETERRFTREQVRGLLADAGFEVAWLSHWNMLLLPAIAAARLLGGAGGSDLERSTPAWVHAVLGGVMAVERGLMKLAPLPCGVSIFAVARKMF
ncbi:MAG: methyltransferase domain-containing protein [Candidatus Hydrogenedens sp.]|nr:methyltransferase domain-containing protein [Candidatus Hydrogenedens sp.]